MKWIAFLSGLISSLITLGIILPADSQVSSDGTTNTTVRPSGNNFDILNGIQKGSNLFHSFQEFSIPTGSEATFNNSTDIVNIINRVTGGNISNIDGLIKANGNANLFLINPAGIVFGENASLNIGGSFLGTTAESILFEDGFEFSAINPQSEPLLTISTPLGLQIGNNPGTIEVQGSGHQIVLDIPTSSLIDDARPVGLQVPSGKTLALIGGDISLQGGNLTAEAGRIELGSVLESAKVELIPTSNGFTIGYDGVNQFGDINLSQATSVEVSGEGAGNLQLQGRQISLLEDSIIIANTQGKEDGGLFSVKASESVEINGGSDIVIFPTGFYNLVQPGGTGNAGNITIETPQLSLEQVSVISVNTLGEGNAGNITLKVDNLVIRERSQVSTGTSAGGNGGDLTLIAADSVEIAGFDRAPSGLYSDANPGSTGDAGNINIDTPQLNLVQAGLVVAATEGEGNAGNITLKVDNLAIRGTSQILTGTFADGNGGDLTLIAADSVEIAGFDSDRPSALFSAAAPGSTGDAGNLNITTPQLSLVQDAVITVTTAGNGNAGKITLKVDNLAMRDGSQISAGTSAGGNGGDLTVIAADSIEIAGFKSDRPSGLFSGAEPGSTGNAGNLEIESNQINIRDGAEISARSAGSGDAGNLNVNANTIFLDNQADIVAVVAAGEKGNINLTSKFIQLRGNSRVVANAAGTANGGNIDINSPVIAGFEDSDIIANAVEGNGGNINITTQGLFGLKFRDQLTDNSDITASSEFGIDGTVEINNVGIEPSSGLVELPELINTDVVIANSCVAGSNNQDSTFYITGKSGFPYTPGEAVPSDYSMFEVRAFKNDTSLKTPASRQRKKGDSIVEATGIYRLKNGELVFGRECKM